MFDRKWTTEEREQIVAAFDAGEMASAIAQRFGVSRNAVIGVIHRERRRRGPQPGDRRRKLRSGPPKRTVKATGTGRARPLAPVVRPLREAAAPPPQARFLTLAEVEAGQCRFPVTPHDAPPAAHRFCGAPAPDGRYCRHHGQIAFLSRD